MNFSMNKAILVGNITKDPELRYTSSGTAVLGFNLATSRSVKNKSTEEWDDVATFHKIVVWGKLAEFCCERLVKGQQVTIEGRIENRSYQTQSGETKYISEIVAENVYFKSPKVAKAAGAEKPAQASKPDERDQASGNQHAPDGSEDVNPDDIPF